MSTTVLWGAFKDLAVVVNNALHKRHPGAQRDLELALQKHKADFTSLLKNPVKNANHRKQIQEAASNPVSLPGRPHTTTLPQSFIDEALLLSDLLDLNEFSSVDLLVAGEQQQPRYPGWSRGLVAVILYHDGRRVFLQCLDALVQARRGRNWQVGVSDELSTLATNFTDGLIKEGLVGKILELLRGINEQTIIEKLQEGRGVGGDVHQRQLGALIDEQRGLLADVLFSVSCQTALSKGDVLLLLQYLRDCSTSTASGTLDSVTLVVLMALFYAISVEHADVDGQALIGSAMWMASVPVANDRNFVNDVHQSVFAEWKNDGLQAAVQLAWSILLQGLSLIPSMAAAVETLEDPGQMFDQAVQDGALLFLRTAVLEAGDFKENEFYTRRMHLLVTAILTQMPHKVNVLRSTGDEEARIQSAYEQEGLEPPTSRLRFDFVDLMKLIGSLYHDEKLGLATEFWQVNESSSQGEASRNNQPLHLQPQHRHVMLQKFLRVAGDMISAPMYVAYVQMLTSLANTPTNSQCCFVLLRSSGPTWRVSLEHIFGSIRQYFVSLKQDGSSGGSVEGRSSRSTSGLRQNITGGELAGLVSVLRLVEQLVLQDESIRLAMYENQQWMPVGTFFGLLGCPVPTSLKAQLLKTLAAFAKTPSIATTLWISMESAQVLQTAPHSGTSFAAPEGKASGGIEVELEDIEASEEEYPETRAFLLFLKTLVQNSPVPDTLGAGYRSCGFAPYLQFIRDSVFLNFDMRSYRRSGEKWEVCCAALEILQLLLAEHQPAASNFTSGALADASHQQVQHGSSMDLGAPPGHTILLHMLNESPLLTKVLNVIFDSAVELGDVTGVSSVPSHLASVEQAGLLALRMLENALAKQEAFNQLLREHGGAQCSVLVTPLDQLLLTVNSRTSRPDYFLHIAKFLSLPHCRPELALAAVKILGWSVQSPPVHNKLVAILTSSEVDAQAILLGFVERLEADESEVYQGEIEQDPSTPSQIRAAIRRHILHMLLLALPCHAPNLAHFLLGYELLKPVSQTTLQDPGVGGSPRTCLHAILSLLECHSAAPASSLACLPVACTASPRLAALCYRLLYELCAASSTSLVTLRYLRSSHDFLGQQLRLTPPAELTETSDSAQLDDEGRQLQLDMMEQQTWLWRMAALDLRLTAEQQQTSHTQHIVSILFSSAASWTNSSAGEAASGFPASAQASQGALSDNNQENRLLSLLDCIDFRQDNFDAFQLQHFNSALVEEELNKRTTRTDDRLCVGSFELYDVRAIHVLLMQELNSAQTASAASQRQFVLEEIDSILHGIVQRNVNRRRLAGRLAFFDAWRQVIEVVLIACPMDLLAGDQRIALLFEIIQDLLLKVLSADINPDLVSAILPVVMLLMSQLRQSFAALRTSSQLPGRGAPSAASRQGLPAGPLHSVLVSVCEAISHCSSTQRRHRAYLYGALLYYLQLCADAAAHDSTSDGASASSGTDGASSYSQERGFGLAQPSISTVLTSSNLETLASYGDAVMDIICRDACEGHHIGRMLALALLDAVISVDWHHHWLQFLVRHGYLRHLIDSLVQEDEMLQMALQPNPEPLRALYIYESKMALLTRLAQTANGAQALLQLGLLGKLSECRYLHTRPDLSVSSGFNHAAAAAAGDMSEMGADDSYFMPSVLERYRQLILPTLKLVVSVQTSAGRQNRDVAGQVSHFVFSHVNVFTAILEQQAHPLTLSALHELMLTTAVVGQIGSAPVANTAGVGTQMGQQQQILLLQHAHLKRLMLGLLPRYCQPQAWPALVKQVAESDIGLEQANSTGLADLVAQSRDGALGSKSTAPSGAAPSTAGSSSALSSVSEQATIWLQQICANTLTFCRHYVSTTTPMKRAPLETTIFHADISDSSLREVRPQYSTDSHNMTPSPPLAALVRQVRLSADAAQRTSDEQKNYQRRLKTLSHLSVEDCQELLPNGVDWAKLSTLQRQQTIRQYLLRLVQHKTQQIDLLLYIIETSLFILWRHVEFYFLHVKVTDDATNVLRLNQPTPKKMRSLGEPFREQNVHGTTESDSVALDSGGLSISRQQSNQFKMDAVVALSDAFLKKLVDLEVGLAKGSGGSKEFIQVFVRRMKRLLKLQQGPVASS
ncbi:nuclear pore complex protein Nup205-like [Sycon ciliatum]|uniref:nuclear pore complex protein Nup205-like n=1 Tax=Sycon ciliatum TaxID=27933 RepID=UPI0031F67E26